MKLKKLLLIGTSFVLTAALAIGGTVAYLTGEDSAVNVMTLGNVKIQQLEYERVADENGEWISNGETDKYGYTPDKVQKFTQAKPLYPAVFEDGVIKWDDRNGSQNASGDGSHQQSWAQIGAPGSNQLFDGSVKNAQDKFVFVENTGKSDAYVRTWFAFEQGGIAADEFKNVIMTNTNQNHWSWETVATDVVIADKQGKENTYVIWCATYLGPKSNPTGILAPGATSYASLLQVYMKPEATNEDVEAIDGNENGTYDILVLSQAVQTAGFDDAKTALDTAFGTDHPWVEEQVPQIPVPVSTAQELKDAMLIRGGKIVLSEDIVVDQDTPLQWGQYMFVANGREVTIDLNGHDIIVGEDASEALIYMFTTANGGTLNIVGDGTLEARNEFTGICWAMNKNDQINIYGGNFKSNADYGPTNHLLYTNSGSIDVYGGKFYGEGQIFNVADDQGDRVCIVFHEGVLFGTDDIQRGDSARIKLEDGCVKKEVTIDGETWYQVVKE